MASETDICNMALRRIGAATIDALDDETKEADVCNELYAQTRDRVLAEFDWPFARARADLAASVFDPPSGWNYRYAVPTDCLVPLRIWQGAEYESPYARIPFSQEGSDLLCNTEQAELLYTARIEDTALFPAAFIDALAWALAAELAVALEVSAPLWQRAKAEYQDALAGALVHAARQNFVRPQPSDAESARL